MPDHNVTNGELITLREYLERRLLHERELREVAAIQHDRALATHTLELARRLDELNHMQQIMQDERRHYMTRDLHEAHVDDYLRDREWVRMHITTIYTWGAAGLLALTVLEFAMRMFWK